MVARRAPQRARGRRVVTLRSRSAGGDEPRTAARREGEREKEKEKENEKWRGEGRERAREGEEDRNGERDG